MTPRKFCECPAEERSKQVALTGHLGAAQVRRAQTWLSSSPRTGGGTSSLLLWIALSGGGLQVEEKPGALLLLLLELESATINPRSELHRPHALSYTRHLQLCFSVHLYTRARTKTLSHSHAHTPPLNRGSSGTHPDDQSVWSGRRRRDRCSGSALLFLPVFVVMVVVSNPRRWGSHMTQPAVGWVKTTAVATVSNAALRKVQKKRKRFNRTSKR